MNPQTALKAILTLILSLTSTDAILAQRLNRLWIADCDGVATNTIEVNIQLDNTDPATAFQLDLEAPAGYTFSQDFIKSERLADTHSVSLRNLSANKIRIIAYASDNAAIRGNSGSLGHALLTIPTSAKEGEEVQLTISNATLSNDKLEDVLTEACGGKLTIQQMPDLEVSGVGLTATSANPGDTIPVNWKVSNVGGKRYRGGWGETIKAIGPDGRTATLYSGFADVDGLDGKESMIREAKAAIPELPGIDGEISVLVEVTPTADSGESQSTSGNNNASSDRTFTLSKYMKLSADKYTFGEGEYRIMCRLARSGSWAKRETFTISNSCPERLSVPQTVTIGAGSSTGTFYISPIDNKIFDGDAEISVIADGNGYQSSEIALKLIDNEKPNFNITVVLDNVTEGKNFPLKIDLGCELTTPTTVKFATDSPHIINLPDSVEIPAGTSALTIAVPTYDNQEINGDTTASIIATTESYGSSTEAVTVIDKDMPSIAMIVSSDVMYQDEGNCYFATISRTTNTDRDVTISLSDDSDGLLEYASFMAEMPAGVTEITVPIYVVGSDIKGGSKKCYITAAVLMKSCGCSAPSLSAGSVSQNITIIDPSKKRLDLSCREVFTSKRRSHKLTVSRNIDLSAPLNVRLSSKAPIVMPASVTIPAGQESVSFDATLDAAFTEGTGIIVALCEASGYFKGSCVLPYTAESLPDAAIHMALDTDTPLAGDKANLTITISNHGDAPLSGNTEVSVSSRGIKDHIAYTLDAEIAPGGTLSRSFEVTFVDAAAKFNIIGTVNGSTKIKEATYTNNTTSINCNTIAPFTCSAAADKDIYFPGDKIKITGNTEGLNNRNSKVSLYLISRNGNIVKKRLATDANGSFAYETTAGQCGNFKIIACYDGALPKNPQGAYDVMGMNVESRVIYCDLKQNETQSATIDIFNPTSIELTGLKFSHFHDFQAKGIDLEIGDIPAIAPGKRASVPLSLCGKRISEANAWESIILTASTDQQAAGTVTLKYRVLPQLGRLEANVGDIDIAVVDGEARDYTLRLTNTGAGETGRIAVSLPEGVKSLTPATLISLKPGESADVSLRFDSGSRSPETVATKGTIAFNCDRGIGLSLPFRLTYASTANGKLKLKVTDEYGYYDSAGVRIETESVFDRTGVAGADVELADAISGETKLAGSADERGYIEADLTSGLYTLKVSAPNHKRLEAAIYIEPGIDNEIEAFCSYEAIRYNWQVTETEIEDNYDMETVAEFTTMVPKPVITIDYPKDGVPILQPFNITVTNHGLVKAYDVNAELEVHGDLTAFMLNDSYIDEIEAGKTIEIEAVLIPNELLKEIGLRKSPRTGRLYTLNDENFDDFFDAISEMLRKMAAKQHDVPTFDDFKDFVENAKWWYMCFYLHTKLTLKYSACMEITAEERKMYARLNSECQEETPVIATIFSVFTKDEPSATVNYPNKPHKPTPPAGKGGGDFIGGPTTGYERLPQFEIIGGPCSGRKAQPKASTIARALTHIGMPLKKAIGEYEDATCASILLEFKQSIALTRQAFKGSLTILNGMPVPMTGIKVMLTITDDQGSPVTSHIIDASTESTDGFNVDAEGLWSIEAGATATASYLFIPTVNAAPDSRKDYSFGGYISFADPETGVGKSLPLRAVTMTVEPTPELDLTYFMQRDVLGDDPLTDEIEASIPAEFSLLVNNVGNGEAKNLTVTTAQPEIIENEKGLKVTYSIVSAQLNGEAHNLALGQSIQSDFGVLGSHSTAYAQWWMESSLLGHFVEYDFKLNHLSSHGNPSLSLIRQASLHELIRGLRFKDDDGKPWRAFLANDMADDESYPDMAYLSDGTTAPVSLCADALLTKLDDSRYELTVALSSTDKSAEGQWIYGNITDPTGGKRRITSVQRLSDGSEIDPYNFWLTDRTLYDYKKPVHECRLHYADLTAASGSESYLITFSERQTKEIGVTHFSSAISDFGATDRPLDEITICFNTDLKPSSVRLNDNVTLSLNGTILPLTAEMITIESDRLTIKPASVTDTDGFYQLTVDCARILDAEGFAGSAKAFFSWTKDTYSYADEIITNDADEQQAYDLLGRPVNADTHRGVIVRKGQILAPAKR